MRVIISKALQKRLKRMSDNIIAKALLGSDTFSDEIFYLGVSTFDPNQISYIDKNKLERYGNFHKWSAKYRVSTRPGRIVQKLWSYLDNKYTEEFALAFAASNAKPEPIKYEYKIVEGEDIRKYYHYETYAQDSGNLGGSCMRGAGAQKFLDIYVKNPDHCKMAVMFDDRGVVARSLLWYPNADKSLVYFDRIYSIDSKTEMAMHKYLTNRRKFKILSDKNSIKPTEKVELRIKLKNLDFKYYPYVDTVRWINGNDINNMEDGDPLHHTNGIRREPFKCEYSGDLMDESAAVTVAAGYMVSCRVSPNYTIHSERYGGHIMISGSQICSITGERFINGDLVVLSNGTQICYRHHPDIRNVGSEWFLIGDENFVEVENQWYRKTSSKIELVDGVYQLKSVPATTAPPKNSFKEFIETFEWDLRDQMRETFYRSAINRYGSFSLNPYYFTTTLETENVSIPETAEATVSNIA